MSKRELYSLGTMVIFYYSWFGRTNPHDGHRYRIIGGEVSRRGKYNRKFFRYTLEDLEELPPRASKIFRMTDSSTFGTTLGVVNES